MRVEGGIVTQAPRGNNELRIVCCLSIPRVIILITVVFPDNIMANTKEFVVHDFLFSTFFGAFIILPTLMADNQIAHSLDPSNFIRALKTGHKRQPNISASCGRHAVTLMLLLIPHLLHSAHPPPSLLSPKSKSNKSP
jgi:hypothetical protein